MLIVALGNLNFLMLPCSFPLEMHMVHWKKAYQNISEAIKHDDGIAVMGYLMSVIKHFMIVKI